MLQAEDPEENVLVRAIAYRRRISVMYNRERLKLDPHLLYFRGEDAFMLALNPEKPVSRDQGPRLGQFKLAGLSEVTLEPANFTPLAGFDGQAPRRDDSVIITAIDSERSVQRQA
ncbi:hypothetical protein [Citromicrobium bathyomarinum]|uniref:hypothetical protein n=1 Tax=Citromicrobium bathyomarinum TaxID=72174 RepID=UPI0012E27AF2|nr:hypothetical protein [Citromicrobium bathyomarinum]